MEFGWSTEQQAFRARVVDFLAAHLPSNCSRLCRHGPGSREPTEFTMQFCPKLAQAKLLAPHWPIEHGGQAAEPWMHFISSDFEHASKTRVCRCY